MTLLYTGTDYEQLAAAFRPIFSRIAQGAANREQHRILPDEQIRWLKEAGFGTVRIPREKGGWGASLPQLIALLIELAEADSNLPQALRAHFAFVEDRLNQPDSAQRDRWFQRFLDGELVGSGWTETGAVKLGEVNTQVTPDDRGWRLSGEKFYSTGTLYADWIDVFARRSDNHGDVIALVSTRQSAVERDDDWDGFGQRLTGSGTTRFKQALVEQEHVYDFAERFRYQTAFYQHILLATLAGIGLAVERDAAEGVKKRSRMYSHGNAAVPRDDPQVLQMVGQISSWVWATRAAVLQAAESLQQAYIVHASGDEALIEQRNRLAEVEAAQAQVVASEWVPRAATELFNALGASDTRVGKALDRHWRNAISATGWSTARRRPLSGRLATAKRRRVSKREGDGEARRRQGLFILRPGGAAHVHFHRQQADTREGIRQRLLLVIDRGRHAFGAVGQAGERFQPDSLIQPGGG